MTVYRDVNEAAYRWPKETPDPLSTILDDVETVYHSDRDWAYKAGYLYRTIQILKGERERYLKA